MSTKKMVLGLAIAASTFGGHAGWAADADDDSKTDVLENGSSVVVGGESAAAATVVAFESCDSQILRIELNAQGKMEKSAILSALKSFSSYPNLVFTPARALSDIAAFHVSLPKTCQEGEERKVCAERSGWTELQWRLKPLKDISVFCEPSQTPSNNPPEPIEVLPEASPAISARANLAEKVVLPVVPVALLPTTATGPVAKKPTRGPASVTAAESTKAAPSAAPLANDSYKVLQIEVVQKAPVKEAAVNDLNGFPVPIEEVSSDARFAMYAGIRGVRVLKETLRRSNGNLEYRKAVQFMGRNGEVFRLIADENLENVQVDPTMGLESAQLDLVSGAVHGVALHLGGEKKRVVVLTLKD